ncbi:hypothetical protein B0H17DRAFT_1125293 [Mycena rosella]|uniref:Uncharacterized protein n=1 Tax=Mycena rosella TaxID=1033263 RepID=A0AAD7M9Y2_MYCRO|nr:hypothetical protein B0H17DRAFT_1125293 [Mycena rosella]
MCSEIDIIFKSRFSSKSITLEMELPAMIHTFMLFEECIDAGHSMVAKTTRSAHIPREVAPGFVALKSTDNIPIESPWKLFTNYVGLDIKQILLMGKSLNYFNSAQPFHIDLFNWLWPKIVQLPSGFSPNYIYDFPDKFGLTYFGVPAPQDLVDALRENILKNCEECYRWVSDDFEVKAWRAYYMIGAPKFVLTEGWTIFCQMLPHFTQD